MSALLEARADSRSPLADLAESGLAESLSLAIRAFNQGTDELRREYERLRGEFERVNVELALKNRQLARSLADVEEVRSHLESVLESMSVGVVACDVEGRVTLANAALESLTGYGPAMLRGRTLPAGFPPLPRPGSARLRESGPRAAELIRVDGEAIPVECDPLIMLGATGAPSGWVVLIRDLRPVRELEREVGRSRTLAALGELAAGIVHEVRNPLGGIEGFGSLLLRSLEPGDNRHRLASKLLEGVHDLKRIVDDLIVLARPAALHLGPVPVREIIARSVDLALNGWVESSGPIDVAVDAGPAGLTALADSRTLMQVLVNLLRNAAEAMPDGGTITVCAGESGADGGQVELTIADTGRGIEPDVRDKIFTPFFTTKEKGTGLGLFIARSIIRAHGGEIELDANEGGGTRIRLTLGRVEPAGVAA